MVDHSCNVRLPATSSCFWQPRQLSGKAIIWKVRDAPQLIRNAGIYCGIGGNKVEIMARRWDYTPELSFPEHFQGLSSNYVDNVFHCYLETSVFYEVLNLRRGMKYLNMEL